ncbi:hypothetical protein G4B88_018076 [Cannabis sativa]|uniref:Uncharacterized protein n=1 Tax=Cannabis sativa TaxID=3483 RepID=A0A7J6FQC3_CANSA|nr:hypothetical protein G4B88_018076 [Cannabis sativa]
MKYHFSFSQKKREEVDLIAFLSFISYQRATAGRHIVTVCVFRRSYPTVDRISYSQGTVMEVVNRVVNAATRAANSNTVLNVCLVGSFVVLSVRSMNQQKDIEALEAQKDSLINSNKLLKKSIWEWKQKLYAEAESDSPLVPLSRLKAIYGEAPVPQNGNASKEEANSTASKFVI